MVWNFCELERIDLRNNRDLIVDSTLIILSRLPNLKEIILFNCRIDSLPPEMKNFKALESLNLKRTRPSNLKGILNSLKEVHTLKKLDLSENGLYHLDESIGEISSLSEVNLYGNHLKTLPETIYKLPNLRVLRIGQNDFYSVTITRIKKSLPNCRITGL